MYNKIVYIGSYAHHTLHQMFDTCFLDVCTRISTTVECYKHSSTFSYINECANKYGYSDKFVLHDLFVYNSKNRWGEIIKNLIGAWQNIRLYLKADNKALLVYSNNNVFSLHLLNLFNRLIRKKTLIVCHGELELLKSKSGGLMAKIQRWLLKDFFTYRRISSNLYFLVLGDSIRINLKNYLPFKNHSHFLSIDHPYYFPLCNDAKDNVNYSHLGTIGTLSKAKGLLDFMKLVSQAEIKFNFSIIGRIPTNEYDDFMQNHNVRVTKKYLSRLELEDEISKLDYVLYFYPKETYSLIASGAIFDAMCLNKPIIALHNDFFDYISKKSGYPFLLFSNVNDMIDFVNNGNLKDLYTADFSVGKRLFSPQVVANHLYSELKRTQLFE